MRSSIFYLSIFFTTLILISSSCSKKPVEIEETEASVPKVYSGGFYNACHFGSIYFNIDTLISYCSFPNSLDDLIGTEDTHDLSEAIYRVCLDDFPSGNESDILADENNWDFKTSPGSNYKLEWRKAPLSQQPVEAKTKFEGGKYPFTQFYNGYKIQISENQVLTLLFFNVFIGGCLHDYMVWEYVETE